MDRRTLIRSGLVALVPAAIARAQTPATPRRVGVLWFGSNDAFREPFRVALAERGQVEGRDITIHHRLARGDAELLPGLAAELVAERMDVIVAQSTPGVQAAMRATRTIPIVMTSAGDAKATDLVANLARPEGNVTGLSLALVSLSGKSVEILREAFPTLARAGCVVLRQDILHAAFLREARAAGARIGVDVRPSILDTDAGLENAFAAMARDRVGAVIVQPIFILQAGQLDRVVELARRHRLPTVSGLGRFADAGGLIAYASEFRDMPARVATYVDRLLRGAKPGDLPVELPTRFELSVNLATARALGVTIAPAVLARADRVIE